MKNILEIILFFYLFEINFLSKINYFYLYEFKGNIIRNSINNAGFNFFHTLNNILSLWPIIALPLCTFFFFFFYKYSAEEVILLILFIYF